MNEKLTILLCFLRRIVLTKSLFNKSKKMNVKYRVRVNTYLLSY